jgi:hypothetical protein
MFPAPSTARGNLIAGVVCIVCGLVALAGIVWILGGWWSVGGAWLLWMGLRQGLRHLRAARTFAD